MALNCDVKRQLRLFRTTLENEIFFRWSEENRFVSSLIKINSLQLTAMAEVFRALESK